MEERTPISHELTRTAGAEGALPDLFYDLNKNPHGKHEKGKDHQSIQMQVTK